MSWAKLVVDVGLVVAEANVTAICYAAVPLPIILSGLMRRWHPCLVPKVCRECHTVGGVGVWVTGAIHILLMLSLRFVVMANWGLSGCPAM